VPSAFKALEPQLQEQRIHHSAPWILQESAGETEAHRIKLTSKIPNLYQATNEQPGNDFWPS
jgi:hypothetical protein